MDKSHKTTLLIFDANLLKGAGLSLRDFLFFSDSFELPYLQIIRKSNSNPYSFKLKQINKPILTIEKTAH